MRCSEKSARGFWEAFLCFYKEGKRNSPFLPLSVFGMTPGSVVAMLHPEGASLGEQANLLRMAEQTGGKNLGA